MLRNLFIAVICATILSAAAAGSTARAATLAVNKSFDVKPGQELRLAFDRIRGDIVIEGWDKNQVQVTGEMRGRDWDKDDELEFDQSPSGVDIAPSFHPHNDDHISADLKIMVPRKFDVRVRAASDTRVEGVEGVFALSVANASAELIDVHGQADISTANGKLHMKGCSLTGDINSVNGGMTIDDSDISGEVAAVNGGMEVSRAPNGLDLSSVNGNVDVGTAAGHIDAQTTNGRIRIKELDGRLTANTVNGGVRLRMVGNANKDHTIEIETLNGSVEIEIPEDFSISFDIEVRSEDRGERYEIVSDFDLDVDSGDSSRRGRYRIRGTGKTGSGKHGVHIRTTNGDVILRKIASSQ